MIVPLSVPHLFLGSGLLYVQLGMSKTLLSITKQESKFKGVGLEFVF